MAAKKKTSGRKYSKAASKQVANVLHERKEGTLKSGRSGKPRARTSSARAADACEILGPKGVTPC